MLTIIRTENSITIEDRKKTVVAKFKNARIADEADEFLGFECKRRGARHTGQIRDLLVGLQFGFEAELEEEWEDNFRLG